MITTRHKLTRYSGSLAVVLGVHALAIALALNWTARPPIELPPITALSTFSLVNKRSTTLT